MNAPIGRTEIPEGVRDRLPREAARMRRLSDQLEDAFRAWGYREVVTPGFEYLETVTVGAGMLSRREDLYQFFDRKGRTLALRPDMTTPIARLAATKLTGEPLPLRLSYFAPIYRHRDSRAGSAHEIWQAGVELIGAGGAAADAEVVALACAALSATGLDGCKVGLGHVDFLEGIFAEAEVSAKLAASLKDSLVARDLVAYEKGVLTAGLSNQATSLLLSLATFQGSFEQAVQRYASVRNERVVQALRELETILAVLDSFGIAGQVSLDLGLARSQGYYTGVVFEGYAPGVGAPVVGGGRYDRLLNDFGGDAPATGFALEMDRLLAALERQQATDQAYSLDILVAAPKGREASAASLARKLRSEGYTVEVDLLGRQGDELAAYARLRGARRILTADGVLERELAAPRSGQARSFQSIH